MGERGPEQMFALALLVFSVMVEPGGANRAPSSALSCSFACKRRLPAPERPRYRRRSSPIPLGPTVTAEAEENTGERFYMSAGRKRQGDSVWLAHRGNGGGDLRPLPASLHRFLFLAQNTSFGNFRFVIFWVFWISPFSLWDNHKTGGPFPHTLSLARQLQPCGRSRPRCAGRSAPLCTSWQRRATHVC